MEQARAEARAGAEAAAEQRLATALALQRAELVKQARSWPCMCGTGLFTAPSDAFDSRGHVVRYMSRSEGKRLSYSYAHALLTEALCLGVARTHRGAR